MQKYRLIFAVLLCNAIILAGCSKSNPTAPNLEPAAGKLLFAMDAGENVASGKIIINKGSSTQELPIVITNHSGSVTFNGLQVGNWQILVQLFDADGVEIYTGTGSAVVLKNQTTIVTITVNHNTGNLEIHVQVPALVLVDDFQSYIVGQSLFGQGLWTVNGSTLPTIVQEGLNKFVRIAPSVSGLQNLQGAQTIPFTLEMTSTYMQFSGRINNNSTLLTEIGPLLHVTDYAVGVLLQRQDSNGVVLILEDGIQGEHFGSVTLNRNEWIDVRTNMDWKNHLATVQYKYTAQPEWITDPALTNIPITGAWNPSQNMVLIIWSCSYGENSADLDNIYFSY